MSERMQLHRFEAEPLAALAFLGIGLMYPIYRGIGALAIGVAVLLVVASASVWMRADRSCHLITTAGAAIGVALVLFRALLRALPSFEWEVPQPLWAEFVYILGVGAVGIVVLMSRRRLRTDIASRWFSWATSAVLVAVVTVICATVLIDSKPLVDVLISHEGAVDVLLDGGDPYADLVFPDTSPLAEPGDVMNLAT